MSPEEYQFWLYMNQHNDELSNQGAMQNWLHQQQSMRDQMAYMQQHNAHMAQHDAMINSHLLHLQATNPALYRKRVELMTRLENAKQEAALQELDRDARLHQGEIVDDEDDDIIDNIFD